MRERRTELTRKRYKAGHRTRLLLTAGLIAGASILAAPGDSGAEPLAIVAGRAAVHSRAPSYLQELCDQVGGRLTGSLQEERAREWLLIKLRQIGLANVRQESWQMSRGWTRRSALASLRSPSHQFLTVASLGWAGSTPQGGVEAPVISVNRNQLEDEQRHARDWRNKILLLESKGKPSNSLDVFGQMGAFLSSARAHGALAVIDAQGTPDSVGMNLTHMDLANATGEYVPLPVVRMAPDHHAILSRILQQGKPVAVWLDVQNQVTAGPVDTANVIAEIRGARYPNEIVLLGAHLDSWDLGQGAADNGFGVAAVLSAAEAIVQSGHSPGRTIRLAFTTGEEQGMKGSHAYVTRYLKEMKNHVAAIFADMGDGPPNGFMLNGRSELVPILQDFSAPAGLGKPMKVTDAPFLLGDSFHFTLAGVPAIDLSQEQSRTFALTRHTVVDTFDKIKPENLVQAAAALAVFTFAIAERPDRIGMHLTREQILRLLDKIGVTEILKILALQPHNTQ